MPNHIHMIVVIGCNIETSANPTLSRIIGAYKSEVARLIHKSVPNEPIWQRSFHDHIIRNKKSYAKIWEYVQYNHQKWEQDCFYIEEQIS